MVKLGLIRHARTEWNREKKFQGRTDIALSQEGMRDARLWGQILVDKEFDLILSSPMMRARQTSERIAEKIEVDVVYHDSFSEQDFGTWEGRTLRDIRHEIPGEVERQESRGWEFCPPGGESRTMVLKRVSTAIEKMLTSVGRKKILLVTHNSVIKVMVYKLLGRDFFPGEGAVLKDYHLHSLTWAKKKMQIEQLNSIKLL